MASPLSTNASTATAAVQPKVKRTQVSRACLRCKRLQKGCSETRPCPRCKRVGLENECLVGDGHAQGPPSVSQLAELNWSYPQLPASLSPESIITSPLMTVSTTLGPLRGRPPALVIGYCIRRFFEKLYPTIPILNPEYIEILMAEDESSKSDAAGCLLMAVCAVVLIQVEAPDERAFEADGIHHSNRKFGELLFDQATAAHNRLSLAFDPSLERVLATFFIYAGHAFLFHHSQGFYFLRETATMWLVLRIQEGDSLRRKLAHRLFWVILVSERSHGIRYRRPVTLQVTPTVPRLDGLESRSDPALCGLRCLVGLFRPLDTVFFSLLNQEDTALVSKPLASLDAIQGAIRSALDPQHIGVLCETQIANLRVTQLWLLVILWQLRLRLGLLVQDVGAPCHLTFYYPVEIGEELGRVVRGISIDSIKVHGAGINEKVFDVACAMVDVLSRVPDSDKDGSGLVNIRYFQRLIHKLPGGPSTYDDLLVKHIGNTLPSAEHHMSSP
ncbi:hypothetical protein B0J18DRAFT_447424 [Chaetomium sp. MPI-SDFR-AT-0129]|uniref:Zn(2)-C6 fungal-type domain-containing protein n=1 Tax=Dichotomopilus funicola TaxID=1934379 RepID=A0AAN6ZJP6_9PEZI|nr:hypothetical protein B0J18DRAFT_447424 [Chaetomium sp. MPI-SDFR-AT-0129]KAK4139896.1 hypothetical protein C8A04DRAFT_40364 [Dichotomopilus funicola]